VLVTDDIWKERYQDINNFELHLARSGTVPIKFFLHISKEEQLERLLARIEDPDKRWKFSLYDVEERKLWDKFIKVYEDTIRHTSTKEAPWYVIPADRKWFARLSIAAILVERLEGLDLQFPKFDETSLDKLKEAEIALREEAKAIAR
jgi:polyphosphate kinase 2 (PPK2 family)